MKGQLTIEYMITFAAFIGLIVFIYLQYTSNIPQFITQIDKEDSRSRAFQLSELLLNDNGHLANWNEPGNPVERIGLSYEGENKTNLVSLEKIEDLDNLCSSGYLDVQDKLAFDEPFSIYFYSINEINGIRTNLLNCTPPSALIKKTEITATVRRITSFYDDTTGSINYSELIIEV